MYFYACMLVGIFTWVHFSVTYFSGMAALNYLFIYLFLMQSTQQQHSFWGQKVNFQHLKKAPNLVWPTFSKTWGCLVGFYRCSMHVDRGLRCSVWSTEHGEGEGWWTIWLSTPSAEEYLAKSVRECSLTAGPFVFLYSTSQGPVSCWSSLHWSFL